MQTDLIIINDFCDRCHVDPSFIIWNWKKTTDRSLAFDEERLPPHIPIQVELERYTHLYYDLSINIAGIDAIHHMLKRRTSATGSAFIKKRTGILPLKSVSERESENCTHFSFRHCSFISISVFTVVSIRCC